MPFPDLGEVVSELRGAGFRISVDSFDPSEIRTAVEAGAELVLSVNDSNLEVARDVGRNARVVVIPDFGQGLDTLDRNIEALERWGVGYLIDPVIEPIGFGFMASLERYAEVHRRYPDARQLMGIGNITELTSADTTGVNAILIAICEELGVRAVLTTEVINWARGAVREIDIARRLMHHAVQHRTLPKAVDDRLLTVKDPKILEYSEAELRELHAAVKDPNFRIFTDRDTITVFNDEIFIRGTDIQQIFSQLGVDEGTHAFYLGTGADEGQAGDHAGQDLPAGGRARLGLPHAAGRRSIGARQADPAKAGPADRARMSSLPLVENLGEIGDPAEVASGFVDLPYLVLLDSGTGPVSVGDDHLARFSFLTADPGIVVRSKGSLTEVGEAGSWRREEGDALGRGPPPARRMGGRVGPGTSAIPGRRRRVHRVRLRLGARAASRLPATTIWTSPTSCLVSMTG